MVEPVSAAVAGGVLGGYVAKRAADGLGRLLGPAADEAALALGRFTETRLRNVGRVLDAAERKAAGSDAGPGCAVPLRLALRVLDEGSYAEDGLVVEYLGGVLASSRTPRGRDDRGNSFLALVARLSTYHLRMHYILHSEMRRVLHAQRLSLGDLDDIRANGRVFVPRSTYLTAMDYGDGEDADAITNHSLWWLDREQLLGWNPGGSVEYLSGIEDLAVPAVGPSPSRRRWEAPGHPGPRPRSTSDRRRRTRAADRTPAAPPDQPTDATRCPSGDPTSPGGPAGSAA